MHSGTHFAITEQGAVVLDIDHDRMLKLNATAAEMWNLLLRGLPADTVVETIAQRYRVDRERVENDLRALVRQGHDLSITPQCVSVSEPMEPEPTRSKPSFASAPPSCASIGDVIKATAGLAFFDVILLCSSLKRLTSVVRSWPRTDAHACDESNAISQVLAAVESASVWYPKTALCLQRSAVTTCLLRSKGVRANMVVGVRPMPFLAHAWVEVDGRVVNDVPRARSFYQLITSF